MHGAATLRLIRRRYPKDKQQFKRSCGKHNARVVKITVRSSASSQQMDTLIWLIDKITVYLCEYITRQPDYRPITVYLESVSRATRKFPYDTFRSLATTGNRICVYGDCASLSSACCLGYVARSLNGLAHLSSGSHQPNQSIKLIPARFFQISEQEGQIARRSLKLHQTCRECFLSVRC